MPTETHTLKSTPRGFGGFLRIMSRQILKWTGWKYTFKFPDTNKFIIVGAPHTSNWDWVMMLLVTRAENLPFHWVGKDSLFRPPIAGLFRKLGGISIDRSQRTNFVQQVIHAFDITDQLILIITPEGTRGKTKFWKSGFYHIALGAKIPVLLAGIDYPTKTVTADTSFYLSGDIRKDMDFIRAFYGNKRGKFPQEQGEPRLAAEEEPL